MFASFDAQGIISFKYHVCVSGYDQNKLDYDTKIFRRLTDDDDKSIIHNYKEKIRVTFMIMERFARPIKHVYLLSFLCFNTKRYGENTTKYFCALLVNIYNVIIKTNEYYFRYIKVSMNFEVSKITDYHTLSIFEFESRKEYTKTLHPYTKEKIRTLRYLQKCDKCIMQLIPNELLFILIEYIIDLSV